jgi:hypothetical protein
MKTNTPQAEEKRATARASAVNEMHSVKAQIKPRWQSYGDELVIHEMCDELAESVKRELQYLRIIKSLGKPPKVRKCSVCAQRKRRRSLEKAGRQSWFRACDSVKARQIIDSIEECWPGFRKVPELLWNQYIDATGICRCGRPIAPKIVSKSPRAAHCCDDHGKRWAHRLRFKRTKAKSDERKSLAEEM